MQMLQSLQSAIKTNGYYADDGAPNQRDGMFMK